MMMQAVEKTSRESITCANRVEHLDLVSGEALQLSSRKDAATFRSQRDTDDIDSKPDRPSLAEAVQSEVPGTDASQFGQTDRFAPVQLQNVHAFAKPLNQRQAPVVFP